MILATGCQGHGTNNIVAISSNADPPSVPNARVTVSFSRVPVVTGITGCTDNLVLTPSGVSAASTSLCDTSSRTTLTVFGTSLLTTDTVMVADTVCKNTRTAAPSATAAWVNDTIALLCDLVVAPENNQAVKVKTMANEYSLENPAATVSAAIIYSDCPTSVAGSACSGHGTCADGTCTCGTCETSGMWTGEACDQCLRGYFGANCLSTCPGGFATPCNGNGVCNDGVNGTGTCSCLFGYTSKPATGDCGLLCIRDTQQRICSGHGTCAGTTTGAVCICTDDPVKGHWHGTLCDDCAYGWYGAGCLSPCRGNGSVCSGHGTCDNGLLGSGNCTCQSGFAGMLCGLACPSANTLPCSGHGTCDFVTAACACNSSASSGFWAGASCSSCQPFYSGANCTVACPKDIFGQVCSGVGVCYNGICAGCPDTTCGAACNITGDACTVLACATGTGLFGRGCSFECPGGSRSPCTGHGTCYDGGLGNGTCSCTFGYSGGDCSLICPGMPLTSCSGHGVCTSGSCVCNSGWAGGSCALSCPGVQSGAICGGTSRGSCFDGAQGNASCTCLRGYGGSSCLLDCPGPATQPCNGHGTCATQSATCTCYDSADLGHYAGSDCAACLSPWVGLTCLQQCPSSNGTQCSGHGRCQSGFATCECDDGWSGSVCDRCASARWGVQCQFSCPGGTCEPCSGRGICSAGRTGTGKCTCNGQYSGLNCETCNTGIYGRSCDQVCPGGAVPCTGHGNCSDGISGTGGCTCNTGWSGSACAQCQTGYFGISCTACPSTPPLKGVLACSGNGKCSDGLLGSGQCICTEGFSGTDCALVCPTAGGLVCSGHGNCLSGQCNCTYPWLGTSCGSCSPGWHGKLCDKVCPGMQSVCSAHGSCDDGLSGSGVCSCDTNYAGPSCALLCPGAPSTTCGGHGTCNKTTGQCLCHASPIQGYWSDSASDGLCNACKFGWTGSSCNIACPVNSAQQVCSNRGTCLVNGTCLCQSSCGTACETDLVACGCPSGWAGSSCDLPCPGGTSNPCNGHGLCKGINATCTCSSGWFGSDCSVACPTGSGSRVCSAHGECRALSNAPLPRVACFCYNGFAGSNCISECPGGYLDPCSGNGRCNDTAQGDGTCTCLSGWAGPACSLQCPAIAGSVCAGHGSCDPTNGTCSCIQTTSLGFWIGVSCNSCAVGYRGTTCKQMCLHGASIDRQCICETGWAGSDCSIPCQGGTIAPCNNKGRCNDTAAGDGSCTCNSGWVGPTCAIDCPGGETNPCSGHGSCTSIGTCVCVASATTGYWAGTACSVCAPEWFGQNCRETCPRGTEGSLCSAHGTCNPSAIECMCYGNSTLGYWTGPACASCQPGYFGSTCLNACPGGACNPCSGHGVCSEGRLGTGVCVCNATQTVGFWSGSQCDVCTSGMYSIDCTLECPGGRLTPCSGHGTCSAGRTGTGTCECFASSSQGWWSGLSCGKCKLGYFGLSCTRVCPGLTSDLGPCSGNGVCSDGQNGTGVCTCYQSSAGVTCGLVCPVINGLICNGVGTCSNGPLGTGTCQCPNNWAGSACQNCISGFAGPLCALECRGGAKNPCNGRGVCSEGPSGDATCACYSGWAGVDCLLPCPGGQANPCSGHGTCDAVNATCTCTVTTNMGWAGIMCSQCADGWSGTNCDKRCPLGSNNKSCNGQGTCVEGACQDCISPFCGPACSESGEVACRNYNCPAGLYGSDCLQRCPGYPSNVCSGHGTCFPYRYGNGECVCNYGWRGLVCNKQCPGGLENCTGHGYCNDEGTCTCLQFYAGTSCELACPGITASGISACNGHGTCNDGPSGNGQCTCTAPYTGISCLHACPFMQSRTGALLICSQHGSCDPTTASCQCNNNATLGHWSGANCDACIDGWHGSQCMFVCPAGRGQTNGTSCQCFSGWGTQNCTVSCPGVSTNTVCSGHGVCSDGQLGTGKCVCDQGYYGADCSVACEASRCFSKSTSHGQCNLATGTCECQDNSNGHWQGSLCDTCLLGYWGANCTVQCACNDHGSCDQITGTCECFQDDTNGHFTGTNCLSCSDGYIGISCKGKDVKISKSSTVQSYSVATSGSVAGTGALGAGTALVDEARRILFLGGNPLVVVNLTNSAVILRQVLDGPLIAAWTDAGSTYFVVQGSDDDPSFTAILYRLFNLNLEAGVMILVEMERIVPTDFSVEKHRGSVLRAKFGTLSTSSTSTIINMVAAVASGIGFLLYDLRTGDLDTQQITAYRLSTTARILANFPIDLSSWLSAIGGVAATSSYAVVSGKSRSTRMWEVLRVYANTGSVESLVSRLTSDPCSTYGYSCEFAANVAVYGASIILAIRAHSSSDTYAVVLARVDLVTLQLLAWDVLAIGLPSTLKISALQLDTGSGAGFVCTAIGSEPTVMYKFNLTTVGVYGSTKFNRVGVQSEQVDYLAVDQTSRSMFAVATLSSISILTVNLYAAKAVTPDIAIDQGGTLLTVTGEGFIDGLDNAWCRLGEVTYPAVSASATGVVCRSLQIINTDSSTECDGLPLDIALVDGRFSENNLPVRIVPHPTIRDVEPSAGSFRGGEIVTLSGYGFVDSSYIKCRFRSEGGFANENPSLRLDLSAPLVTTDATFVSGFQMLCRQPTAPGASTVPAYLDVALDGQNFCPNGIEYSIVGSAMGLQDLAPLELKANASTWLGNVQIVVIDVYGHKLGRLDTTQRPFRCTVVSESIAVNGTFDVTAQAGVAAFDDLAIDSPALGSYRLVFTELQTGWSVSLGVTVVAGDPFAIYIVSQPAEETDNAQRLARQPVVGLRDVADNVIRGDSLTDLFIGATFSPVPDDRSKTEYASADTVTGRFEFSALALVGYHDVNYRIVFSLQLHPEVVRAVSDEITVALCTPKQYAVTLQTTCKDCPSKGAVCNGSTVVLTQSNYWRYSTKSFVFYECGNAKPCTGYTLTGTCKEGFQDFLCSVCSPGYSGSKCGKCPADTSKGWWYIIGIALLLILGLIVMVLLHVFEEGTEKEPLPIFAKMLMTHTQVTSQLGSFVNQVPSLLSAVFSFQGQGSTGLPLDRVTCVAESFTYYHRFLGYIFIPVATVPFALAFPLVFKMIRGLTDFRAQAQGLPQRDNRKSLSAIYVLTVSITVYFAYPVIISACGRMIHCETLDTGEGVKIDYLADYPAIRCLDPLYRRYRVLAAGSLLGYGVGIPLAFVLGVLLVRQKKGQYVAGNLFFFLLAGYKPDKWWFWEAVQLLRKMVIVLVVVFVVDSRQQTYVGMWAMATALALHLYAHPYVFDGLNTLEAASLAVITVTLNLSLLYSWPYFKAPDQGGTNKRAFYALTVFLLTLHIVILSWFIFALVREAIKNIRMVITELKKMRAKDPKSLKYVDPNDVVAAANEKDQHFPVEDADDLVIEWSDDELRKPPLDSETPDENTSSGAHTKDPVVPFDFQPVEKPKPTEEMRPTSPVKFAAVVKPNKKPPRSPSVPALGLQKQAPVKPSKKLSEADLQPPVQLKKTESIHTSPSLQSVHTDEDSSLNDLLSVSCCEIYKQRCGSISVPVQAAVVQLLPRAPGVFDLVDFQLSGVTLSSEELRPLLDALEFQPQLRTIELVDCGLTDTAVAWLCQFALLHPSLREIRLAGNPLTVEGVRKLLVVLRNNPRISVVDVARTQVYDTETLLAIERCCESNAQTTRAAASKRTLEIALTVARTKFQTVQAQRTSSMGSSEEAGVERTVSAVKPDTPLVPRLVTPIPENPVVVPELSQPSPQSLRQGRSILHVPFTLDQEQPLQAPLESQLSDGLISVASSRPEGRISHRLQHQSAKTSPRLSNSGSSFALASHDTQYQDLLDSLQFVAEFRCTVAAPRHELPSPLEAYHYFCEQYHVAPAVEGDRIFLDAATFDLERITVVVESFHQNPTALYSLFEVLRLNPRLRLIRLETPAEQADWVSWFVSTAITLPALETIEVVLTTDPDAFHLTIVHGLLHTARLNTVVTSVTFATRFGGPCRPAPAGKMLTQLDLCLQVNQNRQALRRRRVGRTAAPAQH
eukprot:TRINITY_DN14698_c0_g1_i1.p1 TRINITY_DN14698_c0_g1~~TRINITY_DN14698_c0_g1_i1.p1  ORF type:complete len:4384 (-),score=244.51 TRINITY_DN14698_c0_g1_i1:47-12031(-)